MIQLVPDAPVSLTNDLTTTTDVVIRFSWTDGASDGGSPVIDYTIYCDLATGSYFELEANVLTQHYSTTISLTPGLYYGFKV